MKTSIRLFALIIIGITFTACSKDDDGFDAPTAIETVNINGLENEILSLVNIHRESIGLNRVSVLTPAYSEATNHTKYMIDQGKISHDNFEIRSRNLMTTASAKVVLENVGAGYTTAESLMKAWLNSELHKKNIENPSVQYMGVSAQKSTYGSHFYTQIFIGR